MPDSQTPWSASYRLIAAEKWKAKSAAMGTPLTEALMGFAQPRPGMQVLDLATCLFGVMFFADVDKALGELGRVLRPGARACFVAWGPFEQPYWQSTMGVVLKHAGEPAILPGGQDPFRFAQAGSLARALRKAGFRETSEETKAVPWNWPGGPEELWDYARSVLVPFRAMLDRVPAEKWPEIEEEVHAALREHAGNDGVHFNALVVMASGTK